MHGAVSANKNPKTPRLAGLCVVALLSALALLSSACPSYESTYSGTFREVREELGRNHDAVAIDLFRFGDNVSAIFRAYQRDPITGDPFGKEKYCAWTDAQPFDPERMDFRLFINQSSRDLPRSQLFGTILDSDTVDITLYDDETHSPFDEIDALRMRRVDTEPDPECHEPENMLVEVDFPRDTDSGAAQTMPPEADYQIHNPVLAIAWVGVQPAAGGNQLAPVNRQTPAIPLDDGFGTNFDPQRHALKNERRIAISPPPEIVRMSSGDTTLALAHFVVIDDSEEDRPGDVDLRDWQFNWNTNAEKIVAASLRRATRPACENRGVDHWGPALIFVEGSLNELSWDMKATIKGAEDCAQNNTCDEHFYLVDICAEEDKVLSLLLRDAPSPANVALFVTDEYLNSTSVPLPRVNPYQLWQ